VELKPYTMKIINLNNYTIFIIFPKQCMTIS